MRIEKLIFSTIFLFIGVILYAQNPLIQHFTTAEGLPSNAVYTIFQDSKKFIWFATDAGVSRYDGSKFVHYRKQEGLSSNDVFDTQEDSFGRIWFFHLNARLDFYYKNLIHNEKNTPFLNSLRSDDFFRKMYEDKDRNLYFYHHPGLLIHKLSPQNQVTKYKIQSIPTINDSKPPIKIEGMAIRNMIRNEKGQFIFWTPTGCYMTRSLEELPDLLSNEYRFKDFITSSNNKNFVLTRRVHTSKFLVKRFNNEISFNQIEPITDIESDYITSILEDNNGLLWVSTYDKGVYCISDGKIINRFDIKNAKSVIQDHENNIWICSLKEGVYKINPSFNKYQHIESSAFQNSGVSALAKSDSSGVWCTNGKMVYLLRNNQLYNLDFRNNENSFNQILEINDHTLMVGETSKRPFILEGVRLDHEKKKVYYSKSMQSPIILKKIILNEQTGELNSFNQAFSMTLDKEKFFKKMKINRIGMRVYNTYYNSDNELIINARKNFIFNGTNKREYTEIGYFKDNIITEHLNIDNKTELFNIEGDSLFLWKDKKLTNLTKAFEQPINLQINHMTYHDSTLCIATTSNIYVCKSPMNALQNKSVKIQKINIDFKFVNDILFNADKLFITSNDGLTSVPIINLHELKEVTPIPYFESVQINDKEDLVNQDQISLVSNQRIYIAFSCINYTISPISFSYKLVGTDEGWTNVKGNNVVLHNLSKGKYTFMLRARKPASEWSEPVALGIEVHATIWQHPLLYFFLVLLISGIIFLSIIRRKDIELDRRQMEHQILLLEQKSLQAMMNPHFIFNTLGSIQNYLLHNKPHEAGIYLSQFARLIRQNLNAIDTPMINLEEEVDRLKNYLDLEKLRMGNKFEYTIELDETVESEDILFPSMIIQPFVENAIWHGIANLDENGFIGIYINLKSENALQIIVEDSGIGIANSAKFNTKGDQHLNLGMNITKKRLTLLSQKYDIETNISYSERTPGAINPGTRVTVVAPFIYGRSENPV